MNRVRALFVDNEEHILRSLKRGLRQHSNGWEFQFETSPVQALKMVPEETPAVIISDLEMAEMDGEDLLTRVKQSFPDIVRVLLTADTSEKAVMASVQAAHILLPKPYELSELRDVLDRAYALKKLSLSDEQRSELGKLQNLPVLPKVFHELTDYFNLNSSPDIGVVVELIKRDLGITAKLMQVANSSFFGYQAPTNSLEQMVMRLGFVLVRQLIALMSLNNGGCFQGVLDRANQVTALMHQQAEQSGQRKEDIERLSMLGLLHGLGCLVPSATNTSGQQNDITGAYLLSLWGFDSEIVNAVMFQSAPELQKPMAQITCQLYIAKQLNTGAVLGEIPGAVIECAKSIQQ